MACPSQTPPTRLALSKERLGVALIAELGAGGGCLGLGGGAVADA
jgi:hypothetical protein